MWNSVSITSSIVSHTQFTCTPHEVCLKGTNSSLHHKSLSRCVYVCLPTGLPVCLSPCLPVWGYFTSIHSCRYFWWTEPSILLNLTSSFVFQQSRMSTAPLISSPIKAGEVLRLSPTWTSSVTSIVTSRARPSDGRSLLTVRHRRRRSSPGSGRTRPRCRSCAWWGLWDQTGWPTLWCECGKYSLWSIYILFSGAKFAMYWSFVKHVLTLTNNYDRMNWIPHVSLASFSEMFSVKINSYSMFGNLLPHYYMILCQ